MGTVALREAQAARLSAAKHAALVQLAADSPYQRAMARCVGLDRCPAHARSLNGAGVMERREMTAESPWHLATRAVLAHYGTVAAGCAAPETRVCGFWAMLMSF